MPDCSCFTSVPGKKCFLKSWLPGKFYTEKVLFCYPYGAVYSINVKRCLCLYVVLFFFSKGGVLCSVSFSVPEKPLKLILQGSNLDNVELL